MNAAAILALLVPVLAMRLGRPATLVDINSVGELNELRLSGGALRIGITYAVVGAVLPLVALTRVLVAAWRG